MTWRYGAGEESVGGFKESFQQGGGKIAKEIYVPFPEVEFQAQLTEIAKLKPDAVYAFFAGGGAVKFVKDYNAAGLKGSIPLLGAFLTDGTLQAQGNAAEGVQTTLHYSESLNIPQNKKFQADYQKQYGKTADVYAVQGYDTGLLLAQAMKQVKGNTQDKKALIKAMEQVSFDSPRGQWRFSHAHNPVQDIYLCEVRDGENVVVGVAAKALEDPVTGCKMH
jgi:branched-chain amino acid transport system substrate-binding protein